MHKQMEEDQERFGRTTWASALPRLENLRCMLAKETLQHLRARELCLKQKRAGIQKNVRPCKASFSVSDPPGQGPVQPAVGDPASAGGLD